MQGFSLIDLQAEKLQREAEYQDSIETVSPWNEAERTPHVRQKRVRQALKKFWSFDETYFPPSAYRQGYKKPGRFLKAIVKIAMLTGVHVILGARKHGKTATMKKVFIWKMLRGDVRLGGTMSQVLDVSQLMLDDIYKLLKTPRLAEDFAVEFIVENRDLIEFRVRAPGTIPHTCKIKAFSEDRSVRGFGDVFERPEFLLVDDIQTRTSSLTPEQTRQRARFLRESKSSMTDAGTMIVLGNNFDERTLYNVLLIEQQEGILAKSWHVYVFPAWDDTRGSLWPEAYPAKSEDELRQMLDVADDEEWSGDYQQSPKAVEGETFREIYWTTYSELPEDVRGVIYCDQNLALKEKGDTTGAPKVLYSPGEGAYYIVGPTICQSYDDPNRLLDDVLKLRDKRVLMIGFDGNFSQESVWTNFIRGWCIQNERPYPPHEFYRFKVDYLATGVKALWMKGLIRFPEGFSRTEEGKRARHQIVSFTTKKARGRDDFPDALICAIEMLNQLQVARPRRERTRTRRVPIVEDHYSF